VLVVLAFSLALCLLLDALEILPGVEEALVSLRDVGYLNIVVTNQPDVGAGKLPRATADAMSAPR